ncbi:SDR family NAD(P)-dependent oxidoreductase [Chloroflexota bacterium]
MIDRRIFDLTDRIALVTGGSRGIGRAYAQAVAEFGAKVAIAARVQDKIDETLDILSKYDVETLGISADMTKEEDVQRMVDETINKFGRIDILFNNAGIARPRRPIHEEVIEDFDIIIRTNLRAPFLVLRAVLPVMIKQNKGLLTQSSHWVHQCLSVLSGVIPVYKYHSLNAGQRIHNVRHKGQTVAVFLREFLQTL